MTHHLKFKKKKIKKVIIIPYKFINAVGIKRKDKWIIQMSRFQNNLNNLIAGGYICFRSHVYIIKYMIS